MTPLDEVDHRLRALLKRGFPARPFICSGSPFGCEVAIVGANPSSSTSFWDAWDPERGFDKENWMKPFHGDPANDNKVSRHRIDSLVRSLKPVRCIELNAYPYCFRQYKDIPNRLHDLRVLEYLLSVVGPLVVFASGFVASRATSKLTGVDLHRPGVFAQGRIGSHDMRVLLDEEHFMEWPEEEVEQRCATLAKRIWAQL